MPSWNTLNVPLKIGGQCTLVRADAYRSESGKSLRFMKDDEYKRLEQDRRDFAHYFQPDWDLGTITGEANLDETQAFLREQLNVVHWNLPTDNAGVERALKNPVASGRLVAIINRNAVFSDRVSRPTPGPLKWSTTGGGGSPGRSAYLFPPGTSSFGGEPVLSGSYDPTTQAARLATARGALVDSSAYDGFDLLGAAEEVAGAVLGGYAGSGDDTSTPPGDAQPFEYTPDQPVGDVFDLAKTPNSGEPGTWYTNPGSGQMRLYGSDGAPVVDLDFDHIHNDLRPHAHNWNGSARDGGYDVVPFSPWSP